MEPEVLMFRSENKKVSKIDTRLEKQFDDLLNKYKSCIESNEKECKTVVTENNDLKTG